ncbi:MAG: ATP-dependent zinc protease [Deltaproteobacteria bacterium]|nr:ATP-dependent zinc protease [Deltaproteobacteria bacterium]
MRKSVALRLFLVLSLAALPSAAAGDSHQTEALEDVEIPFSTGRESQKIMIGEVEDVVLVPWGISLPARIDTGAEMSALDARNVTVRNNLADFKLGNGYGDLRLQLPVVGWRQVRTSMGIEERPVVEIGICLGPRLLRTRATLKDRSEMTYPFLLGRNVLNGGFVVDTSRSRAARPACPSGSS